MKPIGRTVLQIVGAMIAIVVVFFIWTRFQSTAPSTSVSKIKPLLVQQATTSSLSPGTYLLYQRSRITDRGLLPEANDDIEETIVYRQKIGDEKSEIVTRILSDENSTGGVVTNILGTDLLVHRYSAKGDALVSLTGNVKEIPENWGLIRSNNGRFQAEFTSMYDLSARGDDQGIPYPLTFTDLQNASSRSYMISAKDLNLDFGVIQPTAISNDGQFIFLENFFPGEGYWPTRLWKLFTNSGEVIELKSVSKLTATDDVPHAFSTFLRPDLEQYLLSVTAIVDDPTNQFSGQSPGGPSQIYLIDTKTDEAKLIFTSDDIAMLPVVLSPDGQSWSYGISYESVWMLPVGKQTSENENYVTQGLLRDWVDGGMVISREANEIAYLDLKTKLFQLINRSIGFYTDSDYQSVVYIGSIRVEK